MSRAQSLSLGPSSHKLNVRSIERNGLSWIDIQQPTEAEMQWLSEKFSFHRLALDDCLSPIQMPKLDDYDTYLFLVMHFPVVDKNVRLTLPAEVDFFVGQSYVITVHNGTLQPWCPSSSSALATKTSAHRWCAGVPATCFTASWTWS